MQIYSASLLGICIFSKAMFKMMVFIPKMHGYGQQRRMQQQLRHNK